MQSYILPATLAVMAVVAALFAEAVYASRAGRAVAPPRPPSSPRALLPGARRVWLMRGLFGVVLAVTALSLMPWLRATRAAASAPTVNVTGHQWYWTIDRDTVPVGTTVVFNVHSGDVGHAMGVFDPSGRLLFQAQGVPGYVNSVSYRFEAPGTYRVQCLEFCGLAHHNMNGAFEVLAPPAPEPAPKPTIAAPGGQGG